MDLELNPSCEHNTADLQIDSQLARLKKHRIENYFFLRFAKVL